MNKSNSDVFLSKQNWQPDNVINRNECHPNDNLEGDEEEFLLHLKFEHGSYPLRHDVNDIDFLGITKGNLFVRIGDSYFMGEYDKGNHSSILFSYDQNKLVSETRKCRSKIFMKRVLLKSKESQLTAPEV